MIATRGNRTFQRIAPNDAINPKRIRWTEIGLAASLCTVLPAGPLVLPALLYVSGWLLMTVAMMLPTVMPLLAIFARITQGRADRGILIAMLILGYLCVWTAFGLVAHATDTALHSVAAGNVFLTFNGFIVGVVVLGIAGAFQFSELKYRCLDKCRTPFSFVNEHWRSDAVSRSILCGLLLGHHAFDVCCRHRQRRLDDGDRRANRRRKERLLGPAAHCAARCRPAAGIGCNPCAERLTINDAGSRTGANVRYWAQSGHSDCLNECPLLGVKRTSR